MNVFPDFDGLGGIGDLRAVIGALLTFVLIVAVLMLIDIPVIQDLAITASIAACRSGQAAHSAWMRLSASAGAASPFSRIEGGRG